MTERNTPSERRKRRRIPLDDRLICFKFYNYEGTLKTEDLPLFIGIKDISYAGLGGMCNRKCELGDHMFINLTEHKVRFLDRYLQRILKKL